MVFGRLLGSVWVPKKYQKINKKTCWKFIDFLMDSGSHFGSILGARMTPKCGQKIDWFFDVFLHQFGTKNGAKREPHERPNGGENLDISMDIPGLRPRPLQGRILGRVLGGKSAPISGFWEPPWIQIGSKMEGFLLVWRILANPSESSRILANPSES